jgi:hypothetical protein
MMSMGHAARRIGRRGAVLAAALAALAGGGCARGSRQPPATDASLKAVAAAVRRDVYDRPVALSPLLAGRVVLYFFRTDCPHCAPQVAAAPGLAARPGTPPLVLISREGPARLRAALGAQPLAGLVVLSDSAGTIMGEALPTRFVPRVVAVKRFAVVLDVTGDRGFGLAGAVASLSGDLR